MWFQQKYSRRAAAVALLPLTAALLGFPTMSAGAEARPSARFRQGGDSRTAVAEGVSSSADDASARDEALKDALRKAVEQSVGVLVDSKTVVQNYQLLEDSIYTNSKGYVRSYNIVKERRAGGLYRVTVEATVSLGKLENDLEDVADRLKMGSDPRILIVLQGPREAAAEVVASLLSEKLLDHGFRVVDAEQAQIAQERQANAMLLDGNADEALRRKLMNIADIVIAGKVRATAGDGQVIDSTRLYSATARCDLKILQIDTGETVARTPETSKGFAEDSQDDASEKALRLVSEKWLEKNLGKLVRAGVDPARTVTCTVQGVTLAQLSELERRVQRFRFARNVRSREMQGRLGLFEVAWIGDARSLATEMEKLAGIKLSVEGYTANTIRLRAR